MKQPRWFSVLFPLFATFSTGLVIEREDPSVTSDNFHANNPFTAKESLVPKITFPGSVAPKPTATVTATLSRSNYKNIPTLTSGQKDVPTKGVTSSQDHGLGIPENAQPTATLTATLSTISPTVTLGPPASPPSGFRNITGANGATLPVSGEKTSGEAPSKRALPSVVDWRNRWGRNWIASIQNQGGCGSCWAFAATALMESMVRVQHGAWSKRSEADLHDSMGYDCETGGWPQDALSWASNTGKGIADAKCDPYDADDRLYFPCADRAGRTLRVPAYQSLGKSTSLQKLWLDKIGPITGAFKVYRDFDSWTPSKGVYKYDGTSSYRGKHAILIVGYNDVKKCWIIKNSWGKNVGDEGFYLIGYGQVEIDSHDKFGISNVDPDPWDRKRHQNGLMLQSGFGTSHKNFQLVRASPYGGFTHIWRQDSAPYTWYRGETVVRRKDGAIVPNQWVIGQPLIISSSFNRDFEVIYLANDNVLRHWYFSHNKGVWFDIGTYGSFIGGYPGYVQTDDSSFALAVRRTDGSLVEYQRDVITADFTFVNTIGNNIMQSGPALVQSNVGLNYNDRNSKGNLYVVAVRNDGRLQMFWRSGSTNNATWTPSEVFGSNYANTPPVMVQDFWRTKDEKTPGGFQLCVAKNGQVQHWQRVNTDIETNAPTAGGPGKWQLVFAFGENIKHVWSLMHGAFNHRLELVAEDYQGRLWHWTYQSPGVWVRKALIPNA